MKKSPAMMSRCKWLTRRAAPGSRRCSPLPRRAGSSRHALLAEEALWAPQEQHDDARSRWRPCSPTTRTCAEALGHAEQQPLTIASRKLPSPPTTTTAKDLSAAGRPSPGRPRRRRRGAPPTRRERRPEGEREHVKTRSTSTPLSRAMSVSWNVARIARSRSVSRCELTMSATAIAGSTMGTGPSVRHRREHVDDRLRRTGPSRRSTAPPWRASGSRWAGRGDGGARGAR